MNNTKSSHTPRVDAVIAETMAKHPGESQKALATYFEAVHQELAPLARDLERENAALRESLARCLKEAEEWIDESRGCKPSDIAGYDGWAEKASRLLSRGAFYCPPPAKRR